jgi:hypothetical protein
MSAERYGARLARLKRRYLLSANGQVAVMVLPPLVIVRDPRDRDWVEFERWRAQRGNAAEAMVPPGPMSPPSAGAEEWTPSILTGPANRH